jgi:hypothetical protein
MTTREANISASIKRLLSTLTSQSNLSLLEVENDLAQTRLLLQEAIEKLSSSFMAIHEAVSEQQQAIDLLLADSKRGQTTSAALDLAREKITKNVYSAVTGLQFQDMTSQLIDRTDRRINDLHDVMTSLELLAKKIPPQDVTGLDLRALETLSKTLEDKAHSQEKVSRKVVSQTRMDSGEIELF